MGTRIPVARPPGEPTTSGGALRHASTSSADGSARRTQSRVRVRAPGRNGSNPALQQLPNPFSPGIPERPSKASHSSQNPSGRTHWVVVPVTLSREARPPDRCVSTCGLLVYQYRSTNAIPKRRISRVHPTVPVCASRRDERGAAPKSAADGGWLNRRALRDSVVLPGTVNPVGRAMLSAISSTQCDRGRARRWCDRGPRSRTRGCHRRGVAALTD
jgi:hypothetical protein